MTARLFLDDPYRGRAGATVVGHTPEGGIVIDRSIFYPTGGGQPGDTGHVAWETGRAEIVTTVKGEGESIVLLPVEAASLPPVGQEIEQVLDWDRRHRHMRVHTALHLLSVVIPLPVTGGSISAEKGRLDFNMPDAPDDKSGIEAALNALVTRDLAVTEAWITDDDLRANPGLVKTMSVAPPMGAGRVRLVRIGTEEEQVDLQPCGGTHVARTGEIGTLRIGKVEKKGRQNRRVYLHLAD